MTGNTGQPNLIVGVGASAGGLEAFKQFLSALPSDTGMVFLLVQHLDPTHKSLLAELLAPCTDMAVCDADQDVSLEPDTVYIIRPDTSLAVRRGRIELSEPTLHRGVRLPVDHLFRSLAQEYGPKSVGIVLSGAGSDGSAGVRSIKAAGGLTIAQNPKSSGQPGMPQSAIDTGVIDLVLEICDIPGALARFQSLPPRTRVYPNSEDVDGRPEKLSSLSEEDLGKLAALLEAQISFDLRVYKPATIERRVLRRMTLAGFDEIEPYFDHLRTMPAEQQTLVRDLLISVTDFFRDPEAYQALRQMVIEPLVVDAAAGDALRVWVPGCATGEEAYSLGMEFLDAIDTHNKRLALQVFATDIDQDALAVGRAAVYPPSIGDHVSKQRLQTYFKPLDGKGFQVRSPLRDTVSFAIHDLTKDPPFSRMHMVSCRNVLIYLTSETQRHVLKVLHFALEPDGYLFLSTSESVGAQRELFSTLSKAQRIYRKVGASRPITVARSRNRPALARAGTNRPDGDGNVMRQKAGQGDLARRAVIDTFAPPTLVVAQDGRVVFSHGALEPFVRIPEGEHPRFELNTILRPELATRVRGALYKCRRNKQSVTVLSSPDSGAVQVRIKAFPAPKLGDDVVILAFEQLGSEGPADGPERPESPEQEAVIEQLEKELQATREDLRNTVEELETSNEELRSSNEESMSMNEELQSANEELEATTEELRSLNEELTTVNSQLREKVDQLEQANDDLNNFFASTKIATVFLDDRLAIKRFTPAAESLMSLDHADIGRFVGDIARELLQSDLAAECKSVLEHLSTCSRELRTRAGRWIARQVLPYRTESRRIEGVVVTFVDVTDLKLATERLRMRERQQSVIAQLGLKALRENGLQSFMQHVVHDVQQTLDSDYCKILELQPGDKTLLLRAGVGWPSGFVGTEKVGTGPDSQAGYTLQESDPVIVEELSKEKRFAGSHLLTDHGVTSGVSCVIRVGEKPYGVLGAHTREQRSFGQEDADFLQAAATVIGLAVARHQTRTQLSLEVAVANVLARGVSMDSALPLLLKSMAAELCASVGEVWWPDAGREVLSRSLIHVEPVADRSRVEERLVPATFECGEGLVGRAYQEGAAQWVTNLAESSRFLRRQPASELGLVSGFGVPIRSGGEVLGVMTFFSADRLIGVDFFIRSLEAIGASIGDFIRRSEADTRARLSEARKAAMINASLDGIVTIDGSGRIVGFNRAAQTMFAYSESEAVGQDIADLIIPERLREQHRQGLARVMAGGARHVIGKRMEMPAVRNDGSEVFVELAITEIEEDDVRLFTGFMRDVTDRRSMEQALRDANYQKDEFLAMLGHELRNPLSAIRSAAELLRLSDGDHQGLARMHAVIDRQSAHMAKLLDGLLDVSRIVHGKIDIERELVNLADTCSDMVAEIRERLDGRQLELRYVEPKRPIWVDGDPVRLSQVFDNLLTNAMKYTPDGGEIVVELARDHGMAELRVRDSGIGIGPELLPHIFDVFRQSRQNLDRSSGGLGLGLSLVSKLVELHGGSIEAKSDGENLGAEFIVRLPVTSRAGANNADDGISPDGPLSIVLIEDREDSAETLRQILEIAGHEVKVASRGLEGVEMARETRPDVVLCDLGLPDGMSGFDVAKALSSDASLSTTRLIALTGYGRPEDKQRSLEAGFDEHLTKPVDLSHLSEVLATGKTDE